MSGSGFISVGVGFGFCWADDDGNGPGLVVDSVVSDCDDVGQVGVEAHDLVFAAVIGVAVGELVGDEPDGLLMQGFEYVVVEVVFRIFPNLGYSAEVRLPVFAPGAAACSGVTRNDP